MKSDRLSKSYIMSGVKSRMGREVAIAFAKSVNCETMEGDFCGNCKNCRMIASGTHLDVQIYESEKTKFGISIVRTIQQDSAQTNYRAKKRVNIIIDAHKMTVQAQNALLKTLEDSVSSCVTILLTDSDSAILPTIHSRSNLLHLPPLTKSRVIEILTENNLEKSIAEIEFDESGGNIDWLIWLLKNRDIGERIISSIAQKNNNIVDILEIAGDTDYHEGLKYLLPQIISRAMLKKNGFVSSSNILKTAVSHIASLDTEKLFNIRIELTKAEKLWNTGIKKTTLLQKTLIPLMT
jgi:DNA polymerase III, delta subunit